MFIFTIDIVALVMSGIAILGLIGVAIFCIVANLGEKLQRKINKAEESESEDE